jgi:hypothetical protein
MNVGSSSKPQSVTFSNTGTESFGIEMIGVGPGDQFSETNNCGSNMAGGTSCTINVTFAPTMTGTAPADLQVFDPVLGGPQTTGLSGTGIPSATPPGSYQASVNGSSGGGAHNVAVSVNVQ